MIMEYIIMEDIIEMDATIIMDIDIEMDTIIIEEEDIIMGKDIVFKMANMDIIKIVNNIKDP
jgi:hypothetical protein